MTDSRLHRIILTILTILSLLPASAVEERRDSVIVSLITCWPGREVYELCGHEALRTRGADFDLVWNYGTFDFNAPNFVYRFVKGETDYMLAGYPFELFMPEYVGTGRHVVEQELNLTPAEKGRLIERLGIEARPENRTYRYNYVLDNCATRIVDRLEETADTTIVWPDSVSYGTFRRAMRSYHSDYPWYQFGIDLALGSGIDRPIRGRQEMFIPLEMMRKAEGAHFADGRPLVKATRVLNEGVPDATDGPTPAWRTPMALALAMLAIVLILCAIMWKTRRIFKAIYMLWFGLIGLTGCVITFLVFVSSHEATSPNLLILWLNPLQLIIAAGVWWRSWRLPVRLMAWYNITVLTVLLIVWPFQSQSGNPAFFPLMAATLLLGVTYAITAGKESYNYRHHNEKVSHIGAGGSHRTGRVGSGSRTTKTRGRNRR